LRFAASAANLQQKLASELKYPPGPAPYMPAAARAWLAPTSCRHWSKSLVSIASNGSATRVAGWWTCGRQNWQTGPSRTVTLDRSWLFLQRNNSHPSTSFAHPAPPPGASGANIKHEHYGNFIVADAAPDETDQRATARMNSVLIGVWIASCRCLQG
jgi:hypothetical protein